MGFIEPVKEAFRQAYSEAERERVEEVRVMRAFKNGVAAGLVGGLILAVMAYCLGNLLRSVV